MHFSNTLKERNAKSSSRAKSRAKTPSSHPFNFKSKQKALLAHPTLLDFNDTLVFAGAQAEKIVELAPLEELFIESGKRVVNTKIEVKGESVPGTFWVGDSKSQNLYQCIDTVMIMQAMKAKIVGRCPELKVTTEVTGFIEITFEGVERVVSIPLKMTCQVPKIMCPINLQNINKGYDIIRIPAKSGSALQIPFKNDSPFDVSFQLQLIGPDREAPQKYHLMPLQMVTAKGNERFILSVDIQENLNYDGPSALTSTIRKLIQLKIAGCSQFFTFPLEVLVSETQQ